MSTYTATYTATYTNPHTAYTHRDLHACPPLYKRGKWVPRPLKGGPQ